MRRWCSCCITNAEDTQVKDEQLWDAVLIGKTAEITQLLAAGADPNGHKDAGNTALIEASISGHTAIVQALLDAGADVNAKDNVRPPRRCRAYVSCAALTTRTVPLLHLAGWQHRPHQGQLPRPHGDRASAARRRGKLQRQGQRTPAPPAPRTRCCALALAHPPCAPRRCPT